MNFKQDAPACNHDYILQFSICTSSLGTFSKTQQHTTAIEIQLSITILSSAASLVAMLEALYLTPSVELVELVFTIVDTLDMYCLFNFS